ncbi:MAG TPA: hypothetical protein VGM88_24175 [Kofleriaceae bacterium]
MKKLAIAFTGLALAASSAWAGVTLRYYNEDSKDYTWSATCSGTKYDVTFEHSRTSSLTIQGSAPCVLHTDNGDVKLDKDANVHIKGGKLTVE